MPARLLPDEGEELPPVVDPEERLLAWFTVRLAPVWKAAESDGAQGSVWTIATCKACGRSWDLLADTVRAFERGILAGSVEAVKLYLVIDPGSANSLAAHGESHSRLPRLRPRK